MELKHLPYLDGWRGAAILLVLTGHFFDLPGSRLGVEVFFALSGMLMSRVLFDQRLPLGTFYRRRLARILPIYYIYLAVMFSIAVISAPPLAVGHFAFSAVFLTSYMSPEVIRSSLPLTHLWSLGVEEHSYVFLSLIALFSREAKTVRLVLTAAAALCGGFYAVYHYFPGPPAGGIFRSECAALPLLASAALHLWMKDTRPTWGTTLFLGSAVGMVACIFLSRRMGGNIAVDYVVKPLCVAVMLNTLAWAPGVVRAVLQMSWLRWFGICSYSLYIWHPAVQELSMDVGIPRWLGLALATAVSALSFYLVEDPVRNFIRNRRFRVRQETAPSV